MAVAAPYAHVTAPLRRLADRYATEVCLALHDGREVPRVGPRRAAPAARGDGSTDRIAGARPTRGAVDLAEAVLLEDRVGEEFDAAVLDVDAPHNGKPGRPPGGTVALDEPPVRARCTGELPLGERVRYAWSPPTRRPLDRLGRRCPDRVPCAGRPPAGAGRRGSGCSVTALGAADVPGGLRG